MLNWSWRRESNGVLSRNRRRGTVRPVLETLEDRLAPAVTAMLDGAVLRVNLNAAGDTANLSDNGAKVQVTGTGINSSFADVKAIVVTGNGAGNQTLNLNGNVELARDLTIALVTDVHLKGKYVIGDDLHVSLSDLSGGVSGDGTFVVRDNATFAAGINDIDLTGANDFKGRVRVSSADKVALTDASGLNLARLSVLGDATITSTTIKLSGNTGDYESVNRGDLVLQPNAPDASIAIGGGTGTYRLSQSEMNALGKDHFGNVIIGRANGKHAIEIGTFAYDDDTAIRTPDGGSIAVNGSILTFVNDKDITLFAPGSPITLNADITTQGGNVNIFGKVILGTRDDIAIVAFTGKNGKGHIVIDGSVNDDAKASSFRTSSFRGDITFDGPVGNSTPIAGLRVSPDRDATLKGPITAGFLTVSSANATLGGQVTTTATGVNMNSSKITLNDGITALGQTVRLLARDGIAKRRGPAPNKLVLEGSGAIDLNAANNDVNVLAARVTGDLVFRDRDGLTVGTVNDTQGIRALFNHSVTLHTGGQLTVGAGHRIDVSSATVNLDSAAGVVEQAGSAIIAGKLLIEGAGTFALNQKANQVATLAAEIDGDLTFRDAGKLTIGTVAGTAGIKTKGGDVLVQTGGKLVVNAEVNTQPGAGGQFAIVGNAGNVDLNVAPVPGAGNIVFVVPT